MLLALFAAALATVPAVHVQAVHEQGVRAHGAVDSGSVQAGSSGCPPANFPPGTPMSPPFNHTHVTNAWEDCTGTDHDPGMGSTCIKTNATSKDYRLCETLCAEDHACYSWAWAGNNLACYKRTDCFWPTKTGTDHSAGGRVSGYKGTHPQPQPPRPAPPPPSPPPRPPPAPAPQPGRRVAVPTPEQLEWMDFEVGAMLGWNLQTICVEAGAVTPHIVTSLPLF